MNRYVGSIDPAEADITLGRAAAVACWRYERGRTRKKSSLVYDFNRLREQLSSPQIADHLMRTDYSRMSFDMVDESKAHVESLAPDYARRHPFFSCARIVLGTGEGFERLGREVRVALEKSLHIDDLFEHLAQSSGALKINH